MMHILSSGSLELYVNPLPYGCDGEDPYHSCGLSGTLCHSLGCRTNIEESNLFCRHPEASQRPCFSDLLSDICKFETELQSKPSMIDMNALTGYHQEADLYEDLQTSYLACDTS